MLRKTILLIAVVFFMVLVLFTGMMFMTNQTEVYSKGDVVLKAEKPAFFTLSDAAVSDKGADVSYKRDLTLFGLPLGSYTVTERSLDNGAVMVFEHVENTSWMPFVVSLHIDGVEEDSVNSWNAESVRQAPDPVYGTDPTSNPFGTIAAGQSELLQGNVYVSRDLELGNGEKVHELRHEISEFAIEEGVLEKSFWISPKYQADTWLMISSDPFFPTESEENTWVEHASQNRLEQLNWLTPQGPLVKIPLTEDLRTEMAYDTIAERTADPVSMEWNEKSPSVFFESMMLNAEINQSK